MTPPDLASNPLLSVGFEIPFDRIEPQHVEPAVTALLADARQNLDAIADATGPRTFESTLAALDRAPEMLEHATEVIAHLEAVATSPEWRRAYRAVLPEVSAYHASVPLHEGLWRALKQYAETDEARALQGEQRRLLDKTIDDFRRNGADLDPAGKERLQQISGELADLTTRFAQNVLDATNAWELVLTDRARLSGLPESALEAARESARIKGEEGWRFTLQAPSYLPVMMYADDATLREQTWLAYNRRGAQGAYDNRPLVVSILALRREQARLLGFASFADLVLADRMAHDGARARAFIDDLEVRTRPAFDRENEELVAFRRQIEGPNAPPMKPWDIGYYAEKRRRELFDVDDEALRPYFPFDRVLEGLFETAKRLYGVEVVEREGAEAWHPSVRSYLLRDADGAALAAFYVDAYPRETKRDGAWMNGLRTGVAGGQRVSPHIGVLAANVNPPIGDRPALLTHRQVETMFHEFGHLLHHCFSAVTLRTLASIRVAWDFVELPSQIMQNWCWERTALDLFARHYETGDPIPDEMLERMLRARTYRAANAMMRQLSFAAADLALHIDYEPARDGEPIAFGRRILERFAPIDLPEEHAMLASFTHLFASPVGYAAGYYSYKWAEVLDADAFTRFKEHGVFDRETGDRFRRAILARGDADDAMALYRAFVGREPSLDPLMERSGLA